VKVKIKDVLCDFSNAIALPLLIVGVSSVTLPKESSLAHITDLLNCPKLLIAAVILTFGLGYTLLNRVRWPFIILAYIAGGLAALQIHGQFFDTKIYNPYVFGGYALMGCAFIASFRQPFHLIIFRKIVLPGSVWLTLIIAIDVLLTYNVKEQVFPNCSVDWRCNLISMICGALIGLISFGLFHLLQLLLRDKAAGRLLGRMIFRYVIPAPENDSATPGPETMIDKLPTSHTNKPVTPDTTTKLLSRTDLPQVKSSGKNRNIKVNVPPRGSDVSEPSAPVDDWLSKHLNALK
jgi:hypothetical protein